MRIAHRGNRKPHGRIWDGTRASLPVRRPNGQIRNPKAIATRPTFPKPVLVLCVVLFAWIQKEPVIVEAWLRRISQVRVSRPGLRFQTKVQSQHKPKDNDDGQDDEEAPPLQLSRVSSGPDAFIKMLVAGFGVLFDVLGVLFRLLDGLVLQDDGRGEVFHELVQLDDGALNLLDVVVSGSYRAEDCVGGC